jgi:A/G-specific adenine glycosylase
MDIMRFRQALLAHHKQHARPLPWRRTKAPYAIWLSEIMLQQTTVATVTPYYEKFLKKFPSFTELANATLEDILHLWQGLGYYSRARNLHACAQIVAQKYGGHLPKTEAELITLPGIGRYTAAAVASIAFNQPATVVDGNVERVISRLYRIKAPLAQAKKIIEGKAQRLTDPSQPGAYAEALMDLGSTICTPTAPQCAVCPVQTFCAACKQKDPEHFPIKKRKKHRPVKTGTAWVLIDKRGAVYLRQRPVQGLLGGLWEVPHTEWEPTPLPFNQPEQAVSCGEIKHVFTHFELKLKIKKSRVGTNHPAGQAFVPAALPPLSSLMKKVLSLAEV